MRARCHGVVTDDQQPTFAHVNPATPDPAPVAQAPIGADPVPATKLSRRMVLLLAGIGVSGAAALGTGAWAFVESQTSNGSSPTQVGPGGQAPGAYGSGMPRGNRPGMPTGARPSGFRSRGAGRRGSAMPSGIPTDQPS